MCVCTKAVIKNVFDFYRSTILTVSRTYLEMPVLVHELVTQDSKPHLPALVNSRSRLYLSSLCPDRFNANGCVGLWFGVT